MDFSGPAVCDFKVLSQAFGFELVVFVPPLRLSTLWLRVPLFLLPLAPAGELQVRILAPEGELQVFILAPEGELQVLILAPAGELQIRVPCMGTGL